MNAKAADSGDAVLNCDERVQEFGIVSPELDPELEGPRPDDAPRFRAAHPSAHRGPRDLDRAPAIHGAPSGGFGQEFRLVVL